MISLFRLAEAILSYIVDHVYNIISNVIHDLYVGSVVAFHNITRKGQYYTYCDADRIR